MPGSACKWCTRIHGCLGLHASGVLGFMDAWVCMQVVSYDSWMPGSACKWCTRIHGCLGLHASGVLGFMEAWVCMQVVYWDPGIHDS
jgi:hypothetical protein